MDERTWDVMASFQRFMDEALDAVRAGAQSGGPLLGEVVEAHLGVDPATVPVVRLEVPSHQFVNLDVAVEALLAAHGGGQLVRIGGGDQRHHQTFGDVLARRGSWGTPAGAVDRARVDTAPSSSREAVALGVHLFRFDGVPVAVLQRRAAVVRGAPRRTAPSPAWRCTPPRAGRQFGAGITAPPQVT